MWNMKNNWYSLYHESPKAPIMVELPEERETFGYDDSEIYGPF